MRNRFLFVLICFICLFGCEELIRRKIGGLGGSYPFVESWKINYKESEIIEAIMELKKENHKLQPPNYKELVGQRDTGYMWNSVEMVDYLNKLKIDSLIPLPEHSYQNSYTDYWLFINFYYSDTKEIVYTWTRPDIEDSSITTFALVGFSKIDDSTDYRLINRDFWYVANKIQIHKFKKEILQPILDKIEERKKLKINQHQ
jgi:hypothetical protein